MAQKIDLGADEWNITFTKGDKEFRIDSLVYTSILLERSKGDDNPPREVIVEAMRECITGPVSELNDHEIWALSVRIAKVMNKAGNA